MQGGVIVEPVEVGGRQREPRPQPAIVVISKGHDRVQAVVAAVQLHDDEDSAMIAPRLGWRLSDGAGDLARNVGMAGAQVMSVDFKKSRREGSMRHFPLVAARL